MSEDAVKRLNLMRFWLFGTFVIVFAATLAFTYMWIVPIGADLMTVVRTALPVWLITAVLAAALYFGYKWWMGRDEGAGEPMAPAAPEPPVAAPPMDYSSPSEGGGESDY